LLSVEAAEGETTTNTNVAEALPKGAELNAMQ
jgi:hypothetical protein